MRTHQATAIIAALVGLAQSRALDLSQGNLTAEAFLAAPSEVQYHDPEAVSTPDKRDCIASARNYYKIVGDGNPHQNYVITQIADSYITCPGSVSQGYSHTVGWSLSGGLNFGTKDFTFGNLGFSVQESDTDSKTWTFDCNSVTGTKPDAMCLLKYTAVTAISVEFWSSPHCGLRDYKIGNGIVYLPNANKAGSTWQRGLVYAQKNMIQCRDDAERNIAFNCGPRGGPEYWEKAGVAAGPGYDSYLNAKEPANCGVPIEALRLGY